MKNYRMITPVLIGVLLFVSFYSLLSGASQEQIEIAALIKKAEGYQSQQLYTKAANQYLEVIEKTGDVNYYYRVIDMYYNAGVYDSSDVWCETALESFPKDPNLYAMRVRALIGLEDYKEAYLLLDEFDSRRLQSKSMEELRQTIKWAYYINNVTYQDVGKVSANYAPMKKKDKYGMVNSTGKVALQPSYVNMGYFANDLVAVCDEKGVWYFVDNEGVHQYNITSCIPGKITEVGLYNEGLIPICVDGKYSYYDLEFKKILADYDYAGAFSNGVAAVRNGEVWQLIDSSGKVISKDTLTEVVLDQRGVCCQNGRVFAKISGKYRMLDTKANIVGDGAYDDVRMFAGSSSLAAVLLNGKWCFIDDKGEVKLEGIYDDVKAFNLGLAPVCVNGKWGYMDQNGTIVIEPYFEYCTELTSSGTAFTQDDSGWGVLCLYEYNH